MLSELIDSQLESLISALGIPAQAARISMSRLASESLRGPFDDGQDRFSALNRDGVPFQWSASAGPHPGGLRFIADCGVPGTRISARIQRSRRALTQLGACPPDGGGELDRALSCVLPPLAQLESSLMGLCVGAAIARDGTTRLKVYVNGEVGPATQRYQRFDDCLQAFGQLAAHRRLLALRRALGDAAVPAFLAIELEKSEISRLKLYFRPRDGAPALLAHAAAAVGYEGSPGRLQSLHRVFLERDSYPAQAVDFSVEFSFQDAPVGFKVDLNTEMFLSSDADVDRRLGILLDLLECDDEEYQTIRRVVVGQPSAERVDQILFVSLALRGEGHQVDIYFHPDGRWRERLAVTRRGSSAEAAR
jgi:hypothetical protein